MINIDNENEGVELTLDWTVTDSLKLGGLTTVRDEQSTSGTFYDSDAELTDLNGSGDTATSYTLKLDWSHEIASGEVLLHVDFVYEENTIDENDPNFFDELRDLPITSMMPSGLTRGSRGSAVTGTTRSRCGARTCSTRNGSRGCAPSRDPPSVPLLSVSRIR